ncbi:MAG: BACON domain-containing protein [Ktedonobacteraceae bacterium]
MQIPPLVAFDPENGEVSGNPLERITSPHPLVSTPQLPQTPQPLAPSLPDYAPKGNVVDHAVHRLNEAAQRIAQVEQGNHRQPHVPRLSPLRDISADIQRQSTPLPQVAQAPEEVQGEDLGRRMPDFWPWLQDAESEESEKDHWSGRTDPLMGRHFPNSAEVARIEEEDLQRAMAEGLVTMPLLPKRVPVTRRRMHLAFIILALLAIVALVMDGGLIFVAFTHQHHAKNVPNGPPSLTLSSNAAGLGQTVILHILHFTPNSNVYLTHDIQETVQLTSGSAVVKVGATGSADVTMVVDSSWTAGFHTIDAEDVTTHYIASATLQITGAGPTRPSRLSIGVSSLEFGSGYQGANTIQSLTLQNSGGNSISWAASSNQPWLLLSPSQGTFSKSQTIAVAVERANLKPLDYTGTITFSSNVGSAQSVQVHMAVNPLPANAGPVLEVIPPVLSFTALDGESSPPSQALTISNPGSQQLNWSITGNNQTLSSQNFLLFAFDSHSNWLSTDQTVGGVAPHATSVIHVMVNSQNLLPGIYTAVLVFAASQGINSPQNVSVSLTVQPRCGLTLSAGSLSFTAVSGQANPSNQSLNIGATSSCAGMINWKAISANNWLAITPASGQLKGSASTVTSIGVNASILKPGTYVSNIAFTAAQSTQTVMVQLIVQAPPPPSAPIMGATPLGLNFSTTQGMPSPPGQVVTITNTGKSPLTWREQVNPLTKPWLGAGPTGGTIPAGQTGQVTVVIDTSSLTPNTYVGQLVLIGTDASGKVASGSPQTVMINLLVLPPCVLQQPSQSSVAFSATQGMGNPSSQSVAITATGNCAWPLNWQATMPRSAHWLQLSPASGALPASGQPMTMGLTANIATLAVGTYTTHVSINAIDGSNVVAQGSPQVFTVTLTILPPCALTVGPTSLAFSVAQGQAAPAAQSFSLSESGTCALPVTWSATGNAAWLSIGSSGSGTGNATVSVSVNPQGLAPGTYSGTITVSASDNSGATIVNSPQTINVSLVVTGYTLSGTVFACPTTTACATSLPGATLTLTNSANKSINATADSSGNYSFGNLATGTYTLTASGSISSTLNYLGTATLTLTGNQTYDIVAVLH